MVSPLPLPRPRRATRSSQIFFTTAARLRHPRTVRKPVAACLLLLAALSCVRGQDQERKLVDRLLKPDMGLQNEAQNKKFIADGASTNKRANVGTFYIQKRSTSKSFLAIGQFLARPFTSHPYHRDRKSTRLNSSHSQI